MAKVGGSYASVVLGVSEQVAHDRRPGQHSEQVNMLSDPVRGLSRRRGSKWQVEQSLGAGTLATYGAEAGAMREYSFSIDGTEYTMNYRADPSAHSDTHFLHCYNKVTNEYLPIVYEDSALVHSLVSGGVSAIVNVGRYVYLAGNSIVPQYTIIDNWGDETNLSRMVAWVRGGAYSRTFTLKITKTDDSVVEVSYKTKSSSYPTPNDTSAISFYLIDGVTPDPEYQKNINDADNAYNGLATAWIIEAAEDITPESIAQKLVDALVLAGIDAERVDGTVVIEDVTVSDLSADDGGDNTLIRAVGREVTAPTLMSLIHYPGKVVRIRPQGASDKEAYYLKAYAKDGVTADWTEVVWREAAGVTQQPTSMFAQALLYNGTVYIAANGAGLEALAPASGQSPDYDPNPVGDGVSSPIMAFMGSKITMLAVFQDRLLVGSGGTINASRPGDYLNFFRHTVLNIQDDDSIEMYAYGSEGDILRYAVMYDKNMILFGDKKQYGIPGNAVLSAKSPNVQTISAHEGATSTQPLASGNFVFYAKFSDGRTSMHQLQIGQLVEAPVSFEVSAQLDQYLKGTPAQLVSMTAPNRIIFRTEEQKSKFYTYTYMDSPDGGQRLFDAWDTWQFNDVLGQICSVSTYNGDVLIQTLRETGGQLTLVMDKLSTSTELSAFPYADSLIPYADIDDAWHGDQDPEDLIVAADNTSLRYMLGTTLDKVTTFIAQLPDVEDALWCGAVSEGFVTPTNPYMRNQAGKAILSGRLTLNQVAPSVVDTGGMLADVYTTSGNSRVLKFSGKLLGRVSNLIGTQPLVTTQMAIGVGREVRECEYTLRTEKWLPLTITSIEWTGQRFDRIRRV
jgi:hypothetical protein